MKTELTKVDIPPQSTNTEPPMQRITLSAVGNYYESEWFFKLLVEFLSDPRAINRR